MSSRISLICVVTASALSAVSGSLWAEEGAVNLGDLTQYKQSNIKLGQLQLHPYYQLTESYDSNIYLVPRDQPNGVSVGGGVVGSWITKNMLGLNMDLPVGRTNHFSGGYEFEAQNYQKQSAANDNIQQKANLQYDYTGPYGLTGQAKEGYLNTSDPAFSELSSRQKRWQNDAGALIDYAPNDNYLAGSLDYNNEVNKYLNPTFANALNRNEQKFGPSIGYRIQPKTRIYTSYHHDIIHYTVPAAAGGVDKDNKAESVDFGVKGILTPTLTGQVQTGITYRKYDVAVPGTSNVTRNWTIDTKLNYNPLIRTTVVFDLNRSLQESTFGTNQFYISSSASLEVQHRLPYKLTAGIFMGMEVDKYTSAQVTGGLAPGTVIPMRRDDIYQEGASLEYAIQQWLTAKVLYMHRERDSIFTSQFNYEDHVTTMTLAVKL